MSAAIAFILPLVLYTYAYHYLWQARIIDIMPGLWFAALAPLAIAGWIFSGSNPLRPDYDPRTHRKHARQVLIWAILFLGVATFSYLFSARTEEQLRALKTLVICVGMFGMFLLAFNDRVDVRAGRVGVLAAVLLGIAINIVDFAGLYRFSIAEGRAAGLYLNPNISGFYLVVGMVLSVSVLPRRLRLPYCLIVGLGVALTFSRSSAIMWLVAVAGLSYVNEFRINRVVLMSMWVVLVMALLVMQFGEQWVRESGLGKHLSQGALQRLHFNLDVDQSAQGRLALIEKSWKLFSEHPWVGHGLGAHNVQATYVQPHNMYLLIGMEMGALGIALYLLLFWFLWRLNDGVTRVFVVIVIIGALFSHNLGEQVPLWLAYALVIGISATAGVPRRGIEASLARPLMRPSPVWRPTPGAGAGGPARTEPGGRQVV